MVNLICFFITAEFTLFSCLFYSPLIQNSRYKGKIFMRHIYLSYRQYVCHYKAY
ncbi:hypothetical protein [Wolbachia endosymbiont (group B) of Ennomos erosarius]|uniref:hypothetical protein n=1 Tax=Wolbachia endosymbiont (group B) of Ennomos erosarius TaxID=3066175 RepID=UPI003132A3D7